MITDYARGKAPGSPEFEEYIKKTGYSVIEPPQYGRLLEAAGFKDVVVDDATNRFIEILEREADSLVTRRGEFLASFSEAGPQLSGGALGDEGAVLQGRRHEMGYLSGVQALVIDRWMGQADRASCHATRDVSILAETGAAGG